MYIAFVITHPNFKYMNENHFNTIYTSILNCVNDNNYVNIFFSSTKAIHKYDKFFINHNRIQLYHQPLNIYTNDIDVMNRCYNDIISKTGYDYHWIIKLRPDLLIFNRNIFTNIKSKYDPMYIHARSRFYIGPSDITKHQRSNWNTKSHTKYDKDILSIMDNQIYFIPYALQFFAFKSASMGLPTNSGHLKLTELHNLPSLHNLSILDTQSSPERNQTIIWNRFNLPLKISELHVVLINDLESYNLQHIK